jgi:hypothetical protein
MFYPTLENRCLVCMKDEEREIDEAVANCEDSKILEALTEWLNEKEYCVEKRQLEKYLADKGIVQKIDEDGMGGAPAAGLATLGDVGGMGNPATPSNGGTNAGFYDAGRSGSGDKFPSLNVGTPAAKKKLKHSKTLLSYLDFVKGGKKK